MRSTGTPMRIAFVVHKLAPEQLGGVEVYTRAVAHALARQGHTVGIFSPSHAVTATTQSTEADGVQIWRVPRPAQAAAEPAPLQLWHTVRNRGDERAFAAFLRTLAPDLVHIQHVQGVSARLLRMAQESGAPVVLTLHDYWFFCANSQLRRPDDTPCRGPSFGCMNCVDCMTIRPDLTPLRRIRPLIALPLALRNRYLRRMAEHADLLIAPSAFLRDQYVAQGFPAGRIVVLENGIGGWGADAGRGHLPAAVRDAVRPRFAFVGSLAPQKGVHLLIEAFNRLPPQAALLVAGDSALHPEYARQVQDSAHHPGIRFLGSLPQPSVRALLAAVDCLVVPSTWYENSPLVIQEAYAAGLPVIAGRIGALEEKVQDGVTGRLFAPGSVDDLAALLRSLVEEPGQLAALRAGVVPPPPMAVHAARLVELYGALHERRNSQRAAPSLAGT